MIKGRNLFCEKVSPLKPLFQKFGVFFIALTNNFG